MRNPKKLYSIDVGFKQVVDIPMTSDTGRIYENIVFLELRRRVKDIYYFKGKQEIDFYYAEGRSHHLINVCYDFEKPATRQREIKGLLEGMTSFSMRSALLLTAEKEEEIQIENKTIHVRPLWKWLLEQPSGDV